jgi:hypothetical protein
MKRISIVGLCLMAVFALSAFAASSASADLKAQLKGGGSVVGTTFLSSVTLPRLFTHSNSEIHCKHATNHGKFLTATLGDILIRFLGCTTSGLKCNTPGAGTEEIHLPLSTLFHLGLAHLTSTVGRIPAIVLLLGNVIEIKCTALATINVRGNVIGALQRNGAAVPLNTAFEDVNLNFQQTTPTSNGLQHLRLILMPGTTGLTTYDLESNTNGGAFELAAEVANALLDGFTTSGGVATQIELVEP